MFCILKSEWTFWRFWSRFDSRDWRSLRRFCNFCFLSPVFSVEPSWCCCWVVCSDSGCTRQPPSEGPRPKTWPVSENECVLWFFHIRFGKTSLHFEAWWFGKSKEELTKKYVNLVIQETSFQKFTLVFQNIFRSCFWSGPFWKSGAGGWGSGGVWGEGCRGGWLGWWTAQPPKPPTPPQALPDSAFCTASTWDSEGRQRLTVLGVLGVGSVALLGVAKVSGW